MSLKAQTALCAALCVFSLICLGESAFNCCLIHAQRKAIEQETVFVEALKQVTVGDILTIKCDGGREITISKPERQEEDRLDVYQRGVQDGTLLGLEASGDMMKQAQEELTKFSQSSQHPYDVPSAQLFSLLRELNNDLQKALQDHNKTEPKLSSGKIKL